VQKVEEEFQNFGKEIFCSAEMKKRREIAFTLSISMVAVQKGQNNFLLLECLWLFEIEDPYPLL
jgi:hypothetical protein